MADEILTPRLRLRPWRHDDLEPLSEIFARPEVWRFPFGRGFTSEETAAFLSRRIAAQDRTGSSPAAAEDRATGHIIGYVGLSVPDGLPEVMPAVEVGWRLDPAYWGRGLATEGGRAALAHGFTDMGLSEIISIYDPANAASGRVMARLGMPLHGEADHPESDIRLRVHRLTRHEWDAGRRLDD